MTQFLQLHFLTSYPPANLNRDDLGRPKTAIMGGRQRLRISSQSLKRAWRTSEFFKLDKNPDGLAAHVGVRTKDMGGRVLSRLLEGGVDEGQAREWAGRIAEVFGKLKKDGLEIEQLAHFSPAEEAAVMALADRLARTKEPPGEDDLNLLTKVETAVDVAMFGRMLAGKTEFNVEAAVQVAHAVTVHETAVEDDFFTAVDDLNTGREDLGAGHMGETEFGAGLFYLYVCVNGDLLREHLKYKPGLAVKAGRALVQAAAMVAPTGKQNSFASRAYASYILAEKGQRQPRSLSVAFLRPVKGEDMLAGAIDRLEETRTKMDQAYGPLAEGYRVMNVHSGVGTLEEIVAFVEAV
ncbi:MAG: type I-E CRISPR-associated protein Cas7/Cse4/CasC [Thermodesulfobacteriota bacterium]